MITQEPFVVFEFVSSTTAISEEYQTLRYYFTCEPMSIELQGFCDASGKALGAVVYIGGIPVTSNVNQLCLNPR